METTKLKTIEIICGDCNNKFKLKVWINSKSRFKRKYCDKCRSERKKAWDNKYDIKAEDCEDE